MIDYWKIRSAKYNKLQWVNNKDILQALAKFSDLKNTHRLLEVGCGSGVVSAYLAGKVAEIWAVDKSKDMLTLFPANVAVYIGQLDLEKERLRYQYFDRIIGRMVFHHLNRFDRAFQNCLNMLKKGGELIIQEGGVLPAKEKAVLDWYANMMSFKEERHNFTIEELEGHFKEAGFKRIQKLTLVDKNFSVNNWLENSGQSKQLQKKVYDLHLHAPAHIKKAYNMRINGKEILINSATLMIKGTK